MIFTRDHLNLNFRSPKDAKNTDKLKKIIIIRGMHTEPFEYQAVFNNGAV